MADLLIWFFSTPYHAIASGNWISVFLGIMLVILQILLVLTILATVLVVVDTIGVPLYQARVRLISTEFSYQRTTTSVIPNIQGVLIPISRHTPASWKAVVQAERQRMICSITEEQFNRLQKGTTVQAMLCRGRLSDGLYCGRIID